MKIYGLQKMTLLDFPGHVACTVFLGGCDFRCPYCHNYELADGTAPSLMDDDGLLRFLEKRRGLLDGVAFTGGEPCLHRSLPDLLSRVRGLGFLTKLDTNGMHPELLSRILQDRLADYVAMDIKNSPEKYAQTAAVSGPCPPQIHESIRLLLSGDTDYEFRTTVVEEFHTASDFEAIGAWIRGARRYFLQPFTDRDTVPFGGLHAPSAESLQEYVRIMRQYVPESSVRGMDL